MCSALLYSALSYSVLFVLLQLYTLFDIFPLFLSLSSLNSCLFSTLSFLSCFNPSLFSLFPLSLFRSSPNSYMPDIYVLRPLLLCALFYPIFCLALILHSALCSSFALSVFPKLTRRNSMFSTFLNSFCTLLYLPYSFCLAIIPLFI